MSSEKDALTDQIIDYCRTNRVSTTEVADALDKSGVIFNCKPLSLNHYIVGRIYPVFTSHGSNYELHEQIRNIPNDYVLMIFSHECNGLAIFGELVAKYALLYKGAKAIVLNGLVRDYTRIRRDNYPIWCEGWTPLGCKNSRPEASYPSQLEKELRKRFEGAVAVCDDGGVTVIENSRITTSTMSSLRRMEIQEDIWAFCLNTLKWDTKRIVCDQAYLTESHLFTEEQKKSLNLLRDLKQFDQL